MTAMTNEVTADMALLKRELLYSPQDTPHNGDYIPVLRKHLPSPYHSSSWLGHTATIVSRMSERPWYTQREMMDETGLDKDELIELNAAIRNSPFLNEAIFHQGLGRKYWSTVVPLVRSGAVDKVLDYEYGFPLRLGLYPGLSCMFFCGFCGRNETASYPGSSIKEGNRTFKRILEAMPESSTLSISGGLEPLTNPEIGDLVGFAKERGIRVPMITNGYVLTPRFVESQPGMLSLDSLRVSLYGVDEESYRLVTGKKRAYALVKENVIEFMRSRNRENPRLKVGFNYIVTPTNLRDLCRLLDTIRDINAQVDNGPGVNFLCIREDFGSVTGGGTEDSKRYRLEGLLSHRQRTDLIREFREFNDRKSVLCPELGVDFGYALVALSDGLLGSPLAKVDSTKMRPSAYPQVSVVVDVFGDVFLYREAGFKDRQGNKTFIAGRITPTYSLEDVLRRFIGERRQIQHEPTDLRFLDAFEHLVTIIINRLESDRAVGIPFELGPVSLDHYYGRGIKDKEGDAVFGTIHQ